MIRESDIGCISSTNIGQLLRPPTLEAIDNLILFFGFLRWGI